MPCKHCPYCLLLPNLYKLYKVCSHPSLLQIERDPQYIEDSTEREKGFKALAFAKVALSPDILEICREKHASVEPRSHDVGRKNANALLLLGRV